MSNEITGLVGCKVKLGCAVCADLEIDVEISDAHSVRNIRTLQDEDDGLSFCQSYFAGIKGKSLCGYLDPSRCALRQGCCAQECCHCQNARTEQYVCFLHI